MTAKHHSIFGYYVAQNFGAGKAERIRMGVRACMIELVMRLAATVWLSSFIGYTAVCIASPLAWFGACALLIPCYYKMMKSESKSILPMT